MFIPTITVSSSDSPIGSNPFDTPLSNPFIFSVTPENVNNLNYNPLFNPLLSNVPYISSVNLNYSQPLFSVYENLNADPKIHDRLTKYYFYKILDKWLYDDMSELLDYLVIEGNIVKFGKSTSKDTDEIKAKKIEFIENNIISKKKVKMMIQQYIQLTGTRWVDLPNNEYYFQQAIEKDIKILMKKKASSK